MKYVFVVDENENCKSEPSSPEIDLVRIVMSEATIKKEINNLQDALKSFKYHKASFLSIGLHGKMEINAKQWCYV